MCVFVCVLPQNLAEMEAVASSVPSLQEEPHIEPGLSSPVSNPASANTATNSEFVSHNTEVQVRLCLSLLLKHVLSQFMLIHRTYSHHSNGSVLFLHFNQNSEILHSPFGMSCCINFL